MLCFYPYKNIFLEDYDHLYASEGVCNCLSSCNSIEYKINFFEELHKTNYSEDYYSYVTIMFKYKDSEYFPLIRYQEFKTKDFLSYFGGLLGLFAGISLLSVIEIIYFFTVRLITNVIRYVQN